MSGISVQDRCRGVLLGLAAGDRNGGPSRMAVRLAESLLELGQFNPTDIVGRYLRWWREGAFDTGPVSERVLELIAAGMSALDASAQVHRKFGGKTAGCNPAHRSSPLAMLASLADDDLPGCAISEARLTHHDLLAGDVAAAVTVLCRSLIRGVAWEDAVQRAAEERQAETSAAFIRPGEARDQRRLCPGGLASGGVLRRLVLQLLRGAGAVGGVRRACQLLPGPRGGYRRCPVEECGHTAASPGPC